MQTDPLITKHILKDCQRILIIKLRFVGDTIWTLPLIENIKHNLPQATIAVMTNMGTEAFYSDSPAVDQIITFPRNQIKESRLGWVKYLSIIKQIRAFHPDAVIELSDSDRPAILAFLSGARIRVGHTFFDRPRNRLFSHVIKPRRAAHLVRCHLDLLEELGMKIFDEDIHVRSNEDAFSSLFSKFPSLATKDHRKMVVIHPGARIELRQWGAHKFARLADLLADNARICLTTGPDEVQLLRQVAEQMHRKVELCSSALSLPEFAALCELADVFVGNDSGPIHIASTRTFTIGLYGPNTDAWAGPWTSRKFIFEEPLACRPCDQSNCRNEKFKACLERIEPETVAAKVREILSGASQTTDLKKGEL